MSRQRVTLYKALARTEKNPERACEHPYFPSVETEVYDLIEHEGYWLVEWYGVYQHIYGSTQKEVIKELISDLRGRGIEMFENKISAEECANSLSAQRNERSFTKCKSEKGSDDVRAAEASYR